MPRFADLPPDFSCPHRDGCPYLEGLPAKWVWEHHQSAIGTVCQYEHQIKELREAADEDRREKKRLELEVAQLKAQVQALHSRQFKGRKRPEPPASEDSSAQPKKRGAPTGHPAWQRAKPQHLDVQVAVPAPQRCPRCQSDALQPIRKLHEHVQEDIVLEPRVRATCFVHEQAYCPCCDRNVWQPGPGELPGSYIGPATKAAAIYLRYELNIPNRKISRFFQDFFGIRFVAASAYGFERQAVRRGSPIYEDLRQKIQALSVAHADETSWRHDGTTHWVWYAGNNDLALFHLDPHRSTEAAQKLFGESFGGVIVADAYAAYNGVHPQDWQSCLAHIKTKAKEIAQELALLNGKASEPSAIQFCQNIQGFVRLACESHNKLSKGRWRAKAAKKKGASLRRKLRALCHHPFRHPKPEAFRQRLLGPEQDHFFTCFRRPNVPPTNNQAERSLRPIVIMRKVIQSTRSSKGLENHSILRSFFETARRQGKKPQNFFFHLFTNNTTEAQAALYRNPLPHLSSPRPNPKHPNSKKPP